MLLRLSADNLETAKAWVRALQAAGLYVQHLQRFTTHQGLGCGGPFESAQMASHRSAPHLSGDWLAGDLMQQQQQGGVGGAAAAAAAADQDGGGGLGLRQRLFSLGRVLSFRPQMSVNSMDSDVSMVRVRQQHAAAKPPPGPAAAAAGGKTLAGKTADDSAVGAATGPKVELRRPATFHGGESVTDVQQQQQQQQQGLQGGQGSMSLQHLRRMLLRTHSCRRCVWRWHWSGWLLKAAVTRLYCICFHSNTKSSLIE
jgi:hypothetical protein